MGEELVLEDVPIKKTARRKIKEQALAELEKLLSQKDCDPSQILIFHAKYSPYLGHPVLGRLYNRIAREL